MHLSTLIQQLLSSIAPNRRSHRRPVVLCYFARLKPRSHGCQKLSSWSCSSTLGEKELIMQDSSGALLPGSLGEKFVNHYTFYAAFASDEEFRLVAGGKALGTIPVSQMMTAGQRILFAGKTWRVEEVDEPQKTIYVSRTSGGIPPLLREVVEELTLRFGSACGSCWNQRMFPLSWTAPLLVFSKRPESATCGWTLPTKLLSIKEPR